MASSNVGATLVSQHSESKSNENPQNASAEYSEDLTALPDDRTQGKQSTTTSEGQQEAHTNPPSWFSSGFRPLGSRTDSIEQSHLEVDRREEAARRAPEPHVVENSTQLGPQLDEDGSVRDRLLQNYVLDDVTSSMVEGGSHLGKFKLTGSRILIKRAPKHNELAIEALEREVDLLRSISDPYMPKLYEFLESNAAIWAVIEYADGRTLRQYVEASGPQYPDMIKAFTTQLFSGIASLFMSGFAHLRICDETILISPHGTLAITSFEYAHAYGSEKVDGVYAAVKDKYGADIYVAPEVFADIKYNARKAVMWSCGVVLYLITVGTTKHLSILNHPSFDSPAPASESGTRPLGRNLSTTDTAPSPSRRKLSTASQQALKVPLIPYPISGGRLSVPAWTRDIISKMLQVSPLRRAELIEVAAKVPKEFRLKDARPLMELAWLDYKHHVGPFAGVNEGSGDSERNSMFSFSGMSAFSRESLGALLPGRRRSTVAKAQGEVATAELGERGSSRRKSTWL